MDNKMKIYEVSVIIDTWYELLDRTCILYANNKQVAEEKTFKYMNGRLKRDHYAEVSYVEEVTPNRNGIIYQDHFAYL